MDEKKGTIKNQVAQITIKGNGFDINGAVKKVLASRGYDVVSKPIMNDTGMFIGEEITVYQTDILQGE